MQHSRSFMKTEMPTFENVGNFSVKTGRILTDSTGDLCLFCPFDP